LQSPTETWSPAIGGYHRFRRLHSNPFVTGLPKRRVAEGFCAPAHTPHAGGPYLVDHHRDLPAALHDSGPEDPAQVPQRVGADYGANQPVSADRAEAEEEGRADGVKQRAQAGRRSAKGTRNAIQDLWPQRQPISFHNHKGGHPVGPLGRA